MSNNPIKLVTVAVEDLDRGDAYIAELEMKIEKAIEMLESDDGFNAPTVMIKALKILKGSTKK